MFIKKLVDAQDDILNQASLIFIDRQDSLANLDFVCLSYPTFTSSSVAFIGMFSLMES